MISVTIRAYAHYEQMMGQKELVLSLPEGATSRHVLAALRELKAGHQLPTPDGTAEEIWRSVVLARNHEILQPDEPLVDGDEIVLLPPLSGG